jgi:nitrate/TMAO reductase-like tetraheme cytochrome c subunit
MKILDLIQYGVLYLLKRKWFSFGILPGLIVLGVAFVIFAGHILMTHPGICLHCHVGQTRIEMWSQSVHPTRVSCVNCHAEPGQLFPHKFSARDVFVNKNCINCHKDVEKKEKQVINEIKITHRMHIQEAELKCVDCHRNIVHEKMIPGTNRPSHATCIECHEGVEKGEPEACLTCHI